MWWNGVQHFLKHKMHKKLFLMQQHVLQSPLEPCPLTYRSTCPAERSRMWEDTGRGRPFLSQLSWGGGEPVATHSMLTELSRTVVNCSTVSLLLSITGGTEKSEWKGKSVTWKHSSCNHQGQVKKWNPPYTFRLNILSSSPAVLVATQVYLPLSAVWAPVTVSVLRSGLILNTKTASCHHYHHYNITYHWTGLKSPIFFFFCGKHYLSPVLLVLLRTSPSFNHWMVGVGVPWARQTSWMLSFSRTPISLGSSDPEILGGTERELPVY